MKSYLMLGALTAVAAQPALAQYRQPYVAPYSDPYRPELSREQIDQLDRRVDNAVRMGIIPREDGRQLRIEADRLRRLHYQFGNDGFSGWERCDLARQVQLLRQDIVAAEQQRFGRGSVLEPRPMIRCDDYGDRGGTGFIDRGVGNRWQDDRRYDGRFDERDAADLGYEAPNDRAVPPQGYEDEDRGAYGEDDPGAYDEDDGGVEDDPGTYEEDGGVYN